MLIDPDLYAEFGSREAVNEALREVVRQRRRHLVAVK